MPIRMIENCILIKRMGLKPDICLCNDGKCIGFGVSDEDDEPCEICKRCTLNAYYEKQT